MTKIPRLARQMTCCLRLILLLASAPPLGLRVRVLVANLGVSRPTFFRYVKMLRECGLAVTVTRRGGESTYLLPISALHAWTAHSHLGHGNLVLQRFDAWLAAQMPALARELPTAAARHDRARSGVDGEILRILDTALQCGQRLRLSY